MSDQRAYIAWVLTRPLALPLDVVRLIVREVYLAGASARRALLRYVRVARIIDFWLWQWWPAIHPNDPVRLMNQLTQHWLNLGQEFWTPRERRFVERRRITQPHRNRPHMQFYLGSPLFWEQWGVGSR